MADKDEEIKDAPDGGQAPQEPQAPSKEDEGKATDTPKTEGQDDLPDKFKGKTASEIAKSYIELEKQNGKHTQEVKQTRDQLAQWQALGRVLEGNPELVKQVESEIARISEKKRGSDTNGLAPTQDDTRIATENIIIKNFEKQYAIDQLPEDKRGAMHQAIGSELADMLDPGGKKSVPEILRGIPLDRLDRFLEKAYKMATVNDQTERARSQAILEARQNQEASFSGTRSSSVPADSVQLSEDERKVARKMGISEEDYLKQKKAIDESD